MPHWPSSWRITTATGRARKESTGGPLNSIPDMRRRTTFTPCSFRHWPSMAKPSGRSKKHGSLTLSRSESMPMWDWCSILRVDMTRPLSNCGRPWNLNRTTRPHTSILVGPTCRRGCTKRLSPSSGRQQTSEPAPLHLWLGSPKLMRLLGREMKPTGFSTS